MSVASSKRLPWTEQFRPRSLDEVILTRKQREQILGWWRAWIVLWNMNKFWLNTYFTAWRKFIVTDVGRYWYRKYISKWKTFFRSKFDSWISIMSAKGKENQAKLFEPVGRGKEISTDLKKNAEAEIKNKLEEIWNKFLDEIKEQAPAIPPLTPYKPLLLVGPPGTGKTSTAYALGWQEGVVIVEFNASDRRNAAVMKDVVNEALKSVGFIFNHGSKPSRIVLLDEVDGLSSIDDRGGFSALLKLIEETKIPIILTANIIHDRKVRFLMRLCINVFLDRPQEYQAIKLINRIIKAKKIEMSEENIKKLAKYAPDFRTIIEALEVYYYTGVLPTLFRDEMLSLQDAIRYAFSMKAEDEVSTFLNVIKNLSAITDMDLGTIILWIWENAYKFLDREKGLSAFYDLLAYADYLYKVGSRNQLWRIAYRDASNILAYALTKYGKKVNNIWALRRIRVEKPTIMEGLMKLKTLIEGEGESKGLRPLLEKYAKYTHISRKDAWYELKFLSLIAKEKPENIGKFFAKLDLSKDSLEIFCKNFIKKDSICKKLLKAFEDSKGKIRLEEHLAEFSKRGKSVSNREASFKKGEQKGRKGTLDDFFG